MNYRRKRPSQASHHRTKNNSMTMFNGNASVSASSSPASFHHPQSMANGVHNISSGNHVVPTSSPHSNHAPVVSSNVSMNSPYGDVSFNNGTSNGLSTPHSYALGSPYYNGHLANGTTSYNGHSVQNSTHHYASTSLYSKFSTIGPQSQPLQNSPVALSQMRMNGVSLSASGTFDQNTDRFACLSRKYMVQIESDNYLSHCNSYSPQMYPFFDENVLLFPSFSQTLAQMHVYNELALWKGNTLLSVP